MQQQQISSGGTKELLKESTWVTIAWEWFQKLLGRAVDPVLWVTMIYAGYQLIPGVPASPAVLNTVMFILQFVALDVGGLGLNQLAREQGHGQWTYARWVAYILIGITLITITYAGIHHTIPNIDANWNNAIEITLVVMRSIMTVLYGPAIKSLKHQEKQSQGHLAELEYEVPRLRAEVSSLQKQVSSGQQEVSNLKRALDSQMRETSMLRDELDTVTGQLAEAQSRLENGQDETFNLRRQLSTALVESDTLSARLDGKQQEIEGLQETLKNGQSWQETHHRQMLDAERQKVSSLEEEVSSLKKKLDTAQLKLDTAKQSTGQQKAVSSKPGKVVQLDTSRRKNEQDESILKEQIRELLDSEPDLSARAIASRVGCSPTTASNWKKFFQGDNCVNE